jgi:hypothetical protein
MEHSRENHEQCVSIRDALILIAIIFSVAFTVGYFYGKKKCVEELGEYLDQHSFADKIYSSVCTLYDSGEEEVVNAEQSSKDGAERESAESAENKGAEQEDAAKTVQKELWYAELCGFPNKTAAERYLARLRARGINARLVTRMSVSKKGAKKEWYQVQTERMEKTDLERLVDRLSQEDRLQSVRMVEEELTERHN